MTIRKYFIYIAIVAILLIAYYYRESIEDSIGKKVKDVKFVSPYSDDLMEREVKDSMGR